MRGNYKDTEIETKSKKVLILRYATALIWVPLIKWLKQRQKVDRIFHSIMLLSAMAIYFSKSIHFRFFILIFHAIFKIANTCLC